jgi:hypothetical protein
MTPNTVARRNDLWVYAGQPVKSVHGNVLKFSGLPPLTVVTTSGAVRERRAKLRRLLRTPIPVGHYPTLWTMHDLTWALGLPHTRRWCGLIGKDLKALGIDRRHNVYGLIAMRTGKLLPGHCDVYSSDDLISRRDATLDDIRQRYRAQAPQRLAACQSMRDRAPLFDLSRG